MKYTIRPSQTAMDASRDRRIEFVSYAKRLALLCVLASIVLSVYTFRGDINEAYSELKAKAQLESMAERDIGRIYFEPDSANLYALYSSSLAVLNHGTLKLYEPSGTETLSLQLGYGRPALEVSEAYAVAYDRGGTSVIVTNRKSLEKSFKAEGEIYALTENRMGFITITHGDERYRSVVSVYDNSQNLVYQWKTSEYYLTNAVLSPDSKSLAVSALTQEEGTFRNRVMLFRLDSDQLQATYAPEDTSYITELYYITNSRICLVCDDRVSVINEYGIEEEGMRYEFGADAIRTLSGYSGENGCVALSLTDKVSGLGSKLVVVSGDRDETLVRLASDEVRRISVSDDYLAVLYTQSVEVLSRELKSYGQPVEVIQVRDLLSNSDGKTLLIYSSEAGYVDLITPFQKMRDNASIINRGAEK